MKDRKDKVTIEPSLPSVLIMMATYNGEKYLRPQLDSILSQKDVRVSICICDDCSTDGTPEICREYANRNPNITFRQNEKNLGLVSNFMQMVFDEELSGYDYYGFSDQDDIWFPDKLSFSIEWIRSHSNPSIPTLFFSDNTNDDGRRQWSETSRFRDCEKHSLTLLTFNWLAGCTMVWNESLAEILRAHPLDKCLRGHDTWVHLVARYCGKVTGTYDHSTMMRRITDSNVVGSQPRGGRLSVSNVQKYLNGIIHGSNNYASSSIAVLLASYRDHIHPEDIDELESFVNYRHSLKSRISYAFDDRFWRPSLKVNLATTVGFLIGYY